jgi:hypothetical protein
MIAGLFSLVALLPNLLAANPVLMIDHFLWFWLFIGAAACWGGVYLVRMVPAGTLASKVFPQSPATTRFTPESLVIIVCVAALCYETTSIVRSRWNADVLLYPSPAPSHRVVNAKQPEPSFPPEQKPISVPNFAELTNGAVVPLNNVLPGDPLKATSTDGASFYTTGFRGSISGGTVHVQVTAYASVAIPNDVVVAVFIAGQERPIQLVSKSASGDKRVAIDLNVELHGVGTTPSIWIFASARLSLEPSSSMDQRERRRRKPEFGSRKDERPSPFVWAACSPRYVPCSVCWGYEGNHLCRRVILAAPSNGSTGTEHVNPAHSDADMNARDTARFFFSVGAPRTSIA